mgnify:CR=1 FL=1
MNDDFNFVQYNQNFDHEFTDKHEWLNVHINLLFNELKDIWIAVHIFNTVDKEWDKRVQEKDVPDYSIVRTTLYESLVYRVVLGLSKIFSDSKEYSLRKATNQVEQIIRDNKNTGRVIAEIRQKLDDSLMIRVIRTYRDKFFAHLDKKSAMSYVRIDSSSAMKYISEQELNEWLLLVRELYLVCFGEELSREFNMPPEEDIIYTFFGH